MGGTVGAIAGTALGGMLGGNKGGGGGGGAPNIGLPQMPQMNIPSSIPPGSGVAGAIQNALRDKTAPEVGPDATRQEDDKDFQEFMRKYFQSDEMGSGSGNAILNAMREGY